MPKQRSAWLQASALFAILIAAYTASFNGTTRVDDEHILAARTQSLALWGEFDSPQVYGNDRYRNLQAMGDQATQIEPMQTVLSATLYRLGVSLGLGGRQAAFTLNLYASAVSAALLLLTVLEFGYQATTAWAVSLAFGLATLTFPYALTFYRDPLAMAFACLAMLGTALAIASEGRGQLIGGVMLCSGLILAVGTKNSALTLAPALLVGFAPHILRSLQDPSSKLRWLWIGLLGAVAVVAVALIPSKGPLARFSLEYYRQLAGFFIGGIDASLVPALLGPWLSLAKSLLFFAPSLLLLLWPRGQRRRALPAPVTRTAVSFAILICLAQGLFYGADWFGGFGWGLRFLLPALPWLILLTAPAMERVIQATPPVRWGFGIALALATFVQFTAAWTPWQPIYQAWIESGLAPYSPAAAWDPRMNAIPYQVGLALSPGHWDTAWLRALSAGQLNALWIPISSAVLAVVAILVYRSRHRQGNRAGTVEAIVLAIAAIALPLYPNLPVVRADPGVAGDRASFRDALNWIEEAEKSGDVMVVDSYGTPLWSFMSNQWSSENRWYSLPFELPDPNSDVPNPAPSQATIRLFDGLLSAGHRIWYLSTPDAPDAGLRREIRWLRENAEVVEHTVFGGTVPVSVYAAAP